MIDLDEGERLLKEAPGGEWYYEDSENKWGQIRDGASGLIVEGLHETTAAHVTWLHNHAPALFAEVRRLREENAAMKRQSGLAEQEQQGYLAVGKELLRLESDNARLHDVEKLALRVVNAHEFDKKTCDPREWVSVPIEEYSALSAALAAVEKEGK